MLTARTELKNVLGKIIQSAWILLLGLNLCGFDMFDLNDRSWTGKSLSCASPTAEIYFSLPNDYYPDPNASDDTSAIRLDPPFAELDTPFFVPSAYVVGKEAFLSEYFLEVLKLAKEYDHSFNDFEHHMWLSLRIACDGTILFFSWYDQLDEMERLFDWLENACPDDQWFDADQGWEMVVIRVSDAFHFRYGGFEQGSEYANLAIDRNEVLHSIRKLRKRMPPIIKELTKVVGEDYWSRYRYDLRTDLEGWQETQ